MTRPSEARTACTDSIQVVSSSDTGQIVTIALLSTAPLILKKGSLYLFAKFIFLSAPIVL